MQRFVYMTGIAIWASVLITCLVSGHHHIPTFNERWRPVIDHPLKSLEQLGRYNFDFCWRCGIA